MMTRLRGSMIEMPKLNWVMKNIIKSMPLKPTIEMRCIL
jgi:hypothetical protein